jgi:hypothetical protein
MHPFVVILRRPHSSGATRGASNALGESISRSRGVVAGFRSALEKVLTNEGFGRDLFSLEPTNNLPIVFLVGTDRLAERIRRMDEVNNVAKNVEMPVQAGIRSRA